LENLSTLLTLESEDKVTNTIQSITICAKTKHPETVTIHYQMHQGRLEELSP
jgi:hypothetical protein